MSLCPLSLSIYVVCYCPLFSIIWKQSLTVVLLSAGGALHGGMAGHHPNLASTNAFTRTFPGTYNAVPPSHHGHYNPISQPTSAMRPQSLPCQLHEHVYDVSPLNTQAYPHSLRSISSPHMMPPHLTQPGLLGDFETQRATSSQPSFAPTSDAANSVVAAVAAAAKAAWSKGSTTTSTSFNATPVSSAQLHRGVENGGIPNGKYSPGMQHGLQRPPVMLKRDVQDEVPTPTANGNLMAHTIASAKGFFRCVPRSCCAPKTW